MSKVRRVVVAAVAFSVTAGPASATEIRSTLTSANGEGDRVVREIGCPAEPGSFYDFGWSGVATAHESTLGGTWSGFTRVHEAGFVTPGAGRLQLAMARGGTAFLEFEGGDCQEPALTVGSDADGDPVATGVLALRPVLGLDAARGLVGSGTATLSLELGPGADNVATIELHGDFDVRPPQLSIVAAYGRWNSLADYVNKRLTVQLAIHNAGGSPQPGNAYGVRLTHASTSGATFTGLPASAGDIPAGATGLARTVLVGARPGRTYSIAATASGSDGLDEPQAPVQGAVSVQASLLP